MYRWLRDSLAAKITLTTVICVLAVSAASAVFLGRLMAQVHDRSAHERATRFAAAIEEALGQEPTAEGHLELQPLLELLCAATGKSATISSGGVVRFSCHRELVGSTVSEQAGEAAVTVAGVASIRRVQPIEHKAACSGCHSASAGPLGYVRVDVPTEDELAEVREQLTTNLVAGAVTAGVLALLLVLVHLVVVYRPVRRLGATVERIRRGDLTARATWTTEDEIGRLAHSLNDMAASIERAEAELARGHRAELAQSEKLAALGQLLTSVAHEIKNQLAGVLGALKVVESDVPDGDPNKPVLGKILAQMERMSQTVVTAMEFARPLKPAVVSVDVAEMLDRAIFFVERQAVEQNVKVHTRYSASLPRARIDEDLMKQVFLNLMLNGVQAMPRGGTLEVETRKVSERAVEVIISDQGVGIPAEHRERIFAPFFSTKAQGTGLGLYIARQIVETQQGQIQVESRPGQGTSFTVRLPADDPAAREESARAAG